MYEVTPWHTVGGQSGQYQLRSPWDTPAELILTQVSGNIAGLVVIGFDDAGDVSNITSNFATSSLATPGWRGMVLRLGANTPAVFPYDPIPVEARTIYIQVLTDAAGAIYVTGHFRRLAPDAGSYQHSKGNQDATAGMVATTQEQLAENAQWKANLDADNSIASRQSRHYSNLRRSNSSKGKKSLADRLAGK